MADDKQPEPPTRAVFVDALGTIVRLEPPWTPLAAMLGVDERVAERAFRVEMACYREHSHEGRDARSLQALRERCAEILSRELGSRVSVETMMSAIRFHAFEDAEPALRGLRDRGVRVVCVSNWDCSLPEVLARCGLGDALDGVVTSARAGARKPRPEIFAPALALAGCTAAEAVHVGDTPEEDVAAARAAGIRPLLLRRGGGGDIASLGEVGEHLRP